MMLDPAVLSASLLDHRGLDLGAAEHVRYVLEQSFRYEYDAPVQALRQRLVIVPPARHGNQYRRAHRLEVTGAPVRRRLRQRRAPRVRTASTHARSCSRQCRAPARTPSRTF